MVTSVSTSTVSTATTTSSTTSSTSKTTTGNASAKAAAQSLITSLGSGSGVDINSLANNLANAEVSGQKAAIQGKIDKSNSAISGYAAIKFVLGNLQTAFADLKDQSDFSSITPNNSQPTAFNVTAGSKADTGSHTVLVNSIAKPQRTLSGGFASPTSTLNGGNSFTLSIRVHGGSATAVTIPQGYTSPQDMVTAINAAGTGVKAQVVNTGNSASPYRIMLTGPTGAANDFTISSNLAQPAAPTLPSVTTTQGDGTTTESSQVSFANGLGAGESVTLAGLTFTAGKDLTATQVASAFTDLANGATGKTNIAYGSYSGSLTGFSTGSVNGAGNSFTATSSNPNTNVTDLAVSTAAADYFNWGKLQTATDATLTVDGMDITSASNTVKDAIAGTTLELVSPTTGAFGATVDLGRDTSVVKTKIQALVTSYNETLSMLGVVADPKSTVEGYGGTLVGNNIVNSVRSQIRNMVVGNSTSPSGTMNALRDIGVSIDKAGQLQIDNTKLDDALQNNFDNVVKMLSNNQENKSKFNTAPAGVAGEAYKKLVVLLDPIGGTLETLSSNQTKKIADYQKQLDTLATRLQTLLTRYTAQFSSMDNLVGQIKSTQTSLKSTFDGMMASYTK
jgi:flagellar hook-associated protein 2